MCAHNGGTVRFARINKWVSLPIDVARTCFVIVLAASRAPINLGRLERYKPAFDSEFRFRGMWRRGIVVLDCPIAI